MEYHLYVLASFMCYRVLFQIDSRYVINLHDHCSMILTCNLLIRFTIRVAWHAQRESIMYSTSYDDRATTSYFLELQSIGALPSLNFHLTPRLWITDSRNRWKDHWLKTPTKTLFYFQKNVVSAIYLSIFYNRGKYVTIYIGSCK